jgi:hypothetical protein
MRFHKVSPRRPRAIASVKTEISCHSYLITRISAAGYTRTLIMHTINFRCGGVKQTLFVDKRTRLGIIAADFFVEVPYVIGGGPICAQGPPPFAVSGVPLQAEPFLPLLLPRAYGYWYTSCAVAPCSISCIICSATRILIAWRIYS